MKNAIIVGLSSRIDLNQTSILSRGRELMNYVVDFVTTSIIKIVTMGEGVKSIIMTSFMDDRICVGGDVCLCTYRTCILVMTSPNLTTYFWRHFDNNLTNNYKCLLGIPWFYNKMFSFNIFCPISFSKISCIVFRFQFIQSS